MERQRQVLLCYMAKQGLVWNGTCLNLVRPERRPKAEIEGHAGDGLSRLGGASTSPAAQATLGANGGGSRVARSNGHSTRTPVFSVWCRSWGLRVW